MIVKIDAVVISFTSNVCNLTFIEIYCYFGTILLQTVVCRQFGYISGIGQIHPIFGTRDGVTWLREIQCSGSERNLDDCGLTWGGVSCNYYFEASVICVNGKMAILP